MLINKEQLIPNKIRKPEVIQEVDVNGDFIFRFRIENLHNRERVSLEDFYGDSVRELLTIVRLYRGSEPIDVDGFVFRNDQSKVISLRKNGR
jgi:hypothetical protein